MGDGIGERDEALLLDMLMAARDAQDFTAGLTESAFLASRLHQNAVIRALTVIGEAAGKVSSGIKAAEDTIEWHQIVGMRHRLTPGYGWIWSGRRPR